MLLRVLKTMLSEDKLPMGEWTKILFQAQMALNFNPSHRLDGVAPVTGFLALSAHTPLKTFYLSKPKITEAAWSTEVNDHIK
jgi:hypothetical protein